MRKLDPSWVESKGGWLPDQTKVHQNILYFSCFSSRTHFEILKSKDFILPSIQGWHGYWYRVNQACKNIVLQARNQISGNRGPISRYVNKKTPPWLTPTNLRRFRLFIWKNSLRHGDAVAFKLLYIHIMNLNGCLFSQHSNSDFLENNIPCQDSNQWPPWYQANVQYQSCWN